MDVDEQTTVSLERYAVSSDGGSDTDEAPAPPPPTDVPAPLPPTNAHSTMVRGVMEAPAPPPPSNIHNAAEAPAHRLRWTSKEL